MHLMKFGEETTAQITGVIMSNALVFLNLAIPFVVKLIIPDGRYGMITIVTDLFVLPISLLLINIFLVVKRIEKSVLKLASFNLFGLALGNLTGYAVWGISRGRLFNPDGQTIYIILQLLKYHFLFVLISWAIVKLVNFLYLKFQKSR